MNQNTSNTKAMSGQIDRLVTGELSEQQRRAVFEWCDADPIRWRQCALAFLEAQTWQQGLAGWTAAGNSDGVAIPETQLNPQVASLPRTNWKVLVASIVVAFLFGSLLRVPQFVSQSAPQPTTTAKQEIPVEAENSTPDIQGIANGSQNYVTVPVRTSLSPNVVSSLRIPVDSGEKPNRATVQPEVPEYVKRKWEKRGFQVAATERFLSARLPDGRDVVVPVSGVEVKYVGKPVY